MRGWVADAEQRSKEKEMVMEMSEMEMEKDGVEKTRAIARNVQSSSNSIRLSIQEECGNCRIRSMHRPLELPY